MKTVLAIGIGSFIGGITRHLLAGYVDGKTTLAFPYGTLVVNIVGCFLIGIVFGLAARNAINNELRLFLATGVIGGFTTFSAFSQQSVTLLRQGALWQAFAYVAASILFGCLMTFLGILLVEKI